MQKILQLYSALTEASTNPMHLPLLILVAILVVMFLLCIVVTSRRPFAPKRKRRSSIGPLATLFLYLATIATFCVCMLSMRIYLDTIYDPVGKPITPSDTLPPSYRNDDNSQTDPLESDSSDVSVDETTQAPTEDPRLSFSPAKTESSDPDNFGIKWEIMVDGEIVDSFEREDPVCFELDSDYFALPGVATFRGNNYRDSAVYGTQTITNATLTKVWSHAIGSLDGHGGCCWTGQPLVVEWDDETKAIMNLYDSKKQKEGLVEVIYATLDGMVHFYDMDDGSKTRDPISVGMNFKGAGSLDPRGYPLLYVGSGYNTFGKNARMFIISLIDGSILYEYGNNDSFALRNWTAFDSSPLVDAQTDTLIWPGESGVLYTYKLNTNYDKQAGTISIDPVCTARARYTSDYSKDGRYLGMESSISVVDDYLYVSENGGLFFCVDINTMKLIWAQDTKDDSNSSPVFEWGKDGKGYIYTAPSLHWTAKNDKGSVSIYKLDAETGEILWTYEKDCVRNANISGGVQATPVLGRKGSTIDGMVIYNIACTPSFYKGVITALDTGTGEVIWEVSTGNYAWSSPVALYTQSGKAYIFFANASGNAKLLDAETGETVASIELTGTTEASPVVFNNTIIIGTRDNLYCLKVS